MKTIQEVLQLSTQFLAEKGFDFPRREAEEIVSSALDVKRLQLFLDYQKPLTEDELERCRTYLRRRALYEPIGYIQGFVDFYDCRIQVCQDVLIPRQETEILVDEIVKEIERRGLQTSRILDLCTGSGCIAIALKKKFEKAIVYALDISLEALKLAKRNALANQVDVQFVQSDFLEQFLEKVDIIVCNPPYVSQEEYLKLDKSVAHFEPKLALLGGEDGLDFYRKLEEKAPRLFEKEGLLFLEMGGAQGASIQDLFSKEYWKEGLVKQDYAQKERFFFAKYSALNYNPSP